MADLERLRAAVRSAEQEAARAPDDPRTLRRLADALSLLGFEFGFDQQFHDQAGVLMDRAIALYRRVLAVAPDDGVALTNLGAALSDRGDHLSARDLLERAVVLLPTDRNAHFNLGVAMMNTGGGDARAHFEKAAELQSTQTREAYFDPHGY